MKHGAKVTLICQTAKIGVGCLLTIAKNIDGFRLRARGTGEFSAKTINLEATLKKASALLGDGTTPDTNPDTGKDTPGGENTGQGGSGTTGEGGGDGLE